MLEIETTSSTVELRNGNITVTNKAGHSAATRLTVEVGFEAAMTAEDTNGDTANSSSSSSCNISLLPPTDTVMGPHLSHSL